MEVNVIVMEVLVSFLMMMMTDIFSVIDPWCEYIRNSNYLHI